MRFFVLGWCFFELDCVDLDTILGVMEGGVDAECVSWCDLARFGVFGEGSEFGTGEGLECAIEFLRC